MSSKFDGHEPRATKFMIVKSPKSKEQKPSKHTNIFLNTTNSELPVHNKTIYSFVGDTKFREKMLSYTKTNEYDTTFGETFDKTNRQEDIQSDRKYHTICKYSSSIQTGLITNKLSKAKQIDITREARIMNNFRLSKLRDTKIANYLNKTLQQRKQMVEPKRSMTFNSVFQIYAQPNPEKFTLINDNIPQYWKNSLRDNQKRLKRHVKGNTFKQSIAQQMLQTLRGRQVLQSSIPKIKAQYIDPPCPRQKINKEKRRGFSLKGKVLDRIIGQETNQSFVKAKNQSDKNRFQSNFDEIHTVKYDAKNRWRVSQMSP